MASLPQLRINPAEYVALEQKLGVKHEYHDGQMFAMAGGSLAHSRLQVTLARRVDEGLSDGPCSAYSADVRVVIDAARMATYPDLSIVYGPAQGAKEFRHSITNPTVLIEVLSPSTERYDRGVKFDQYRKLESLREYVLVSQHEMAIDLFRLENGQWIFYPLRGEDAVLSLTSAGIEIPLRGIYRNVPFEDAEQA
ncbi:MAG: Uma2 family endonuclease [Bryobacteraceae bacterium]